MLRYVLECRGVSRHVAESHLPLAELLDVAANAFGHLPFERIPNAPPPIQAALSITTTTEVPWERFSRRCA
ncbi:hypothetical protein [Streptomyces sp. NPDC059743]|uniref:hypothetical protein n=1 Tax=Streptomyces sp. NPDC059743 TaxID=3346928 RepID=UPI0036561919